MLASLNVWIWADGVRGVRLSKQIMQIAADALKKNITNLGPLVLPVTEQIKFFCNLLARKALRNQLPLGPLSPPLAAVSPRAPGSWV